ncbi:hypothetical protein [Fictibacillus terranigra]|uniref:Uncharacterized protein n=1 Tax=Fictibacillus terranigra TaxID=3058424 RepID=A0ABT8E8P5_9BACL|nr:hypothetical protein [Fictibacillus sp. CENA-BCM004]MDN4074297.1 hypothetical protein [Fictibacillus sp. CENA-BCM004]
MTCFIPGGRLGGAEISDWGVYQERSLQGGLGYTEDKLKTIFSTFTAVECRRMNVMEAGSAMFGVEDFLTALVKK